MLMGVVIKESAKKWIIYLMLHGLLTNCVDESNQVQRGSRAKGDSSLKSSDNVKSNQAGNKAGTTYSSYGVDTDDQDMDKLLEKGKKRQAFTEKNFTEGKVEVFQKDLIYSCHEHLTHAQSKTVKKKDGTIEEGFLSEKSVSLVTSNMYKWPLTGSTYSVIRHPTSKLLYVFYLTKDHKSIAYKVQNKSDATFKDAKEVKLTDVTKKSLNQAVYDSDNKLVVFVFDGSNIKSFILEGKKFVSGSGKAESPSADFTSFQTEERSKGFSKGIYYYSLTRKLSRRALTDSEKTWKDIGGAFGNIVKAAMTAGASIAADALYHSKELPKPFIDKVAKTACPGYRP